MPDGPQRLLQDEFDRAAEGFAERTKGRFDAMDVVSFARTMSGESIVEVGAGTGNFLALFKDVAARRVAIDITHGMLAEARRRDPSLELIQADGSALPLRSGSIDLVTSAQAFHHIHEPLPVLKEMRRVAGPDGRVLIVDQIATERYEEMAFMTEVESLRDPSHAASRPASVMRMLVLSAGLEIVDERLHEDQSRFSKWMWPGEFPAERIAKVREFVSKFGDETGMGFEPDGDDFTFTRRRLMLLANRPV
ncbi:MAG: class I SAM-dependent methyltransferase [Actinomycetota bacterium]